MEMGETLVMKTVTSLKENVQIIFGGSNCQKDIKKVKRTNICLPNHLWGKVYLFIRGRVFLMII